jgi:CMP-2-keto-3-deoxyoctulosonic acid synthetase
LYLGARIGIVETTDKGIGVDTPEDVAFVEQLIRAMKP